MVGHLGAGLYQCYPNCVNGDYEDCFVHKVKRVACVLLLTSHDIQGSNLDPELGCLETGCVLGFPQPLLHSDWNWTTNKFSKSIFDL